jgi:phospholipid/cholesterol/gamma-HCH transport system permease protein
MILPHSNPDSPPEAHFKRLSDQHLILELRGHWRMDRHPPAPEELIARLEDEAQLQHLSFATTALDDWDSTLVVAIAALKRRGQMRGIAWDAQALPDSLCALLELAEVPAERDTSGTAEPPPTALLGSLGEDVLALANATGEIMHFFGEGTLTLWPFVRGKTRFRITEFWSIVQAAGAEALPIVALVCFLVGMILAYIGNQQLEQFGARIYIADLVGLAMVIQIGALITAIVLAGRTGAAFAAQIGAMQANEEIDALRTLGVSPMAFLVLPRMLALMLMTPLLALYADLFGILGGIFVGTTVAGLTLGEYLIATRNAIALNHIAQGLISATVYGAIVAASGCLRGMQCGRSAAAVGRATTSAVVTAILFIVIAAAVLTVLFEAIGLS